MKALFVILAVIGLYSLAAIAGECRVTVTRDACPGHEKVSYNKCGGKQTCDEVKKVDKQEMCLKEATRACTVFRTKETKSKKVTATFDGAPLNNGQDFCSPPKPEFNYDKCS